MTKTYSLEDEKEIKKYTRRWMFVLTGITVGVIAIANLATSNDHKPEDRPLTRTEMSIPRECWRTLNGQEGYSKSCVANHTIPTTIELP